MFVEMGIFLHLKFEFSGVDIKLSNESFKTLFNILDFDLFHVLQLQIGSINHVFVKNSKEKIIFCFLE